MFQRKYMAKDGQFFLPSNTKKRQLFLNFYSWKIILKKLWTFSASLLGYDKFIIILFSFHFTFSNPSFQDKFVHKQVNSIKNKKETFHLKTNFRNWKLQLTRKVASKALQLYLLSGCWRYFNLNFIPTFQQNHSKAINFNYITCLSYFVSSIFSFPDSISPRTSGLFDEFDLRKTF